MARARAGGPLYFARERRRTTGWLSPAAARWLWALTFLVAIVWLCALIVRESGAADAFDRMLVIVMVISMNAVGITLGNGQLIIHMLPPLIVAAAAAAAAA
jgi:hypothetical protein